MMRSKKQTRILLVQPPSDCVEDDRLEPPLGLLYMAASLKKAGYENISLLDMTGSTDETERNGKIQDIPKAEVYGISCFATNYLYAKKIIKQIRKIAPRSLVVLGGPNPTALPQFTLEDSGANAIVTGEGEDVLIALVNRYTEGGNIHGVFQGVGRKDIDSYPFPERCLANLLSYSRRLAGRPVVSLLSSRGCSHRCIHCNSVVMGGGNKNVRYRSVDNIIDELSMLRQQYQYFRFNDDHFTGNPHLKDLLAKMATLDIRFRIFARVEDLDNETCRLLKHAGCIHVSVGLESMNPDNLRAIGKAFQIGKEKNLNIAKDHGLIVRASFMVGLPHDSDSSIEEAFARAVKTGIDEFAIYPLIPYPGTLIAKSPEKFGYEITNHDFTSYVQIGKNRKTVFALRHKNFKPRDVERWLRRAEEILLQAGIRHMKDSDIAK